MIGAMRLKRSGLTTLALAASMLLALSDGSNAQTTREQAKRLVGIALVTDWVVTHCGADGLGAMLLLTMPSVLKQLDTDDLARGRKRVVDIAARYKSKAAACADMKEGLISIQ